jgi:hypothetical protein
MKPVHAKIVAGVEAAAAVAAAAVVAATGAVDAAVIKSSWIPRLLVAAVPR